ncbi:hypothetical protein RJ639_019886 [Escallonia herrerae]|uniref:PPM-type phosphatase domain-containing protein n=1 Tax=Escallonia herrerae TaxID=1293975 RepID=A0AA88VAZ5_9ASTE|nr:hypothetical protein RJ639_019886 [Escallonia herrerae]
MDVGSTASIVVLLDNVLNVANPFLCPLITPDKTDERQRIEDAGGFDIWADGWRVGGVLPFTRAFGYRRLKRYVAAEPGIEVLQIDDGVEFIIIASAVIWNVLSNEEAVTSVRDIRDAEAASEKLAKTARARKSSGNITCLVVRFGDNY